MDPLLNEIVGSVGSYGWSGALNTYFWVDPQEQLIGLVWAQMPDLYRYPIERQFMTLAYQAIDD
jgi:CubicO group peptidase (beta-lactamase class C family)